MMEINQREMEFSEFLDFCDRAEINMPLDLLMTTGFFSCEEEIKVFFFSADGINYQTDVSLSNKDKYSYIKMVRRTEPSRLIID